MKVNWELAISYTVGILLASLVLVGIKMALGAAGVDTYESDFEADDYESDFEEGGDYE
jgi:hypothetical protein